MLALLKHRVKPSSTTPQALVRILGIYDIETLLCAVDPHALIALLKLSPRLTNLWHRLQPQRRYVLVCANSILFYTCTLQQMLQKYMYTHTLMCT